MVFTSQPGKKSTCDHTKTVAQHGPLIGFARDSSSIYTAFVIDKCNNNFRPLSRSVKRRNELDQNCGFTVQRFGREQHVRLLAISGFKNSVEATSTWRFLARETQYFELQTMSWGNTSKHSTTPQETMKPSTARFPTKFVSGFSRDREEGNRVFATICAESSVPDASELSESMPVLTASTSSPQLAKPTQFPRRAARSLKLCEETSSNAPRRSWYPCTSRSCYLAK